MSYQLFFEEFTSVKLIDFYIKFSVNVVFAIFDANLDFSILGNGNKRTDTVIVG